ncbi:MAG: anti-anti-sigma factor [Flavobacteriales bacterium]|nr:STAS domain-containing protein [Bacteroidales bacterium AH-315-I05]PCJ86160.1 MAG: anti-anti-sigma factor [Flavobacteriales bacterium]
MSFKIQKKDKYSLVTPQTDKLDGTLAPGLKSEFVMVNAEGFRNIILDLSNTRYCDSSGLSAILVANRLCKNAGGTLVMCCLQETVMKLVSISQLDSILNITPTLDEAVDLLFMEEIERGTNNEDK